MGAGVLAMTRLRHEDLLSIPERERIDEVCLAFEDQWLRGERPLVERYLAETDVPLRGALLHELLLIELEYRRGWGEVPAPADYLDRFEDDSIVRRAFAKVQSRSVNLAFLPGHQIGRYCIKSKLGAGAFGTVYLAWDDQLQREVAIKVPHGSQLSSLRERDRFMEEARVVARLKHPGIVPIYDSGRLDDDRVYLVMQYVNGRSLREVISGEGVDVQRAVEIVVEAAEAVHCAHRNGVVHRDLKPGNILIDADGRVHVADFGLAVREQDVEQSVSEHAGTLAYMAPEQLQATSAPLDARADVWALGVILYELLSGKVPFVGPNGASIAHRILQEVPRRLRRSSRGVSKQLDHVCQTCLAKRPEQRYHSAAELASHLRDCNLPRHGRAALAIASLTLGGLLMLFMTAQRWDGPLLAFDVAPGQVDPDAIDVVVWNPNLEASGRLRMSQQSNASLYSEDRVRLELRLARPAFIYVIWMDSSGKALPVYPWQNGEWTRRPSNELPRKDMALPSDPSEYWLMEDGPAGMETVLLLARQSPLPETVSLQHLLREFRTQTIPVQPGVWRFVNGQRFGPKPRGPLLKKTATVTDPLLKFQWRLVDVLRPHFDLVQTISFPFRRSMASRDRVTSLDSKLTQQDQP
jgi:serine/threonine protein kinase